MIRSPFRQLTAACAALTLGMVVLEAGQATTGVPAGRRPPAAVDHRAILQRLDDSTLARGRELYANACAACHGTGAVASLPAARSFAGDALKYGADPYSMWQTVTYGRGMMAAQSWLTPEERYFVIQYIREAFIRPHNPSAYVPITASYLRGLPKPAREASEEEVARAAAEGLQSAGQTWAQQRRGDYGSALYSQLRGRASSALTVALDHGVHVSYDLLRMRLVAAWAGELDVSTTKFQRYRGEGMPFVAGDELPGLGVWQWADGGVQTAAGVSPRSPLPAEQLVYHGHYVHGRKVILSYRTQGRDVLDMPAAVRLGNGIVIEHALRIGPSSAARALYVAQLDGPAMGLMGTVPLGGRPGADAPLTGDAAGHLALAAEGDGDRPGRFVAAGAIGATDGFRWEVDRDRRLVLHVPARDTASTVRVLRYTAQGKDALGRFSRHLRQLTRKGAAGVPDLERLTQGGGRRWEPEIAARGRLNDQRAHYDPVHYEDRDRDTPGKLVALPSDYPYTVDDIGLPFDNPWRAWIRPTDLAFLADGRLVLATYVGDVWLASGVDRELRDIRWRRIATGLFEPMGIEIVAGQIYVTARDRIVRLRDLNGDDEIDFYESFYADTDVSDFFHAFAFGLVTDPSGHFYYAKSGQYTSNANPGDLVRVARDGRSGETLATGFRTPNGVTAAPDGRIFVSDNQGNWTPANEINLVVPGGFYGYVPNIANREWAPDGVQVDIPEGRNDTTLDTVPVPSAFREPVLWLPQEFDNSPGGGVWSDPGWGPLGDRFIHTSFGKGWIYQVMLQEIDGLTQGAAVALPFQFDAGTQRAAVNPVDRQIYVTGLTGWDDGFATKYGHLSRVRHTGGTGRLLTGAEVRLGGIALTFNFPVDRSVAADPGRYEVLMWDYRWERRYGSRDWSVQVPGSEGRDRVPVDRVDVSEDGRTVLLQMPDIRPADQVRVRMDVRGADGVPFTESLYLTIHRIPESR